MYKAGSELRNFRGQIRFDHDVSPGHGRSVLSGVLQHALGLALCIVGAYLMLLTNAPGRGLASAADPYQVAVAQTTADLSQRLSTLPSLEFAATPAANEPVISINAAIRYQTVHGFGAAMTDSSAWLIERGLSPTARQTLMSELFGSSGIGLDFVKVAMGASDFTVGGHPYTYDDLPRGRTDPTLAHFSIAHDLAYILPALRQTRALDPATQFLATPWSPPAWMKTNHSLGNAGDRGALIHRYYLAWAAYFVKLIRAYAGAGIPIGAVTLQNEPGVATLYPGLDISAAQEAAWVVRDLKPALAKAKLQTKVYGGDLGWGPTTAYTGASSHGRVKAALSGLAWHCYFGSPSVMSQFHQTDPDWAEIVDECSPGISPTPISEILISSLRNWASTIALWNVALTPSGGPAQLPNHGCEGCQGLATIDPQTGAATLNPSYYDLGQASAFVAPGARRIASGHFVTYRYPGPGVNVVTPGLDDVALRNPDGSIVLITYDNSTSPISFAVTWARRTFSYTLPAGATATFVWNRP
jgi:glucosylceramidase